MHSQQMASIAPIVIRCIEYLAYGTIFTHVMFRQKIKPDVFSPARKAIDEPGHHPPRLILDYLTGIKSLRTRILTTTSNSKIDRPDDGNVLITQQISDI